MSQIWSVSHELFHSNPDHGLPVAQVRDGDILVKAGDNEVQLVQDADGTAGGHPLTWGQIHHGTGTSGIGGSWGTTVLHFNNPLTAHWDARATPAQFAEHMSQALLIGAHLTPLKGTITQAQVADYYNKKTPDTHPVYQARILTDTWPQGPITIMVYWFSLGNVDNPPATARVHLDRLDGRQIAKPEFYEWHGTTWHPLPDTWPGGAPLLQGAKCDGHAKVWDNVAGTWKPMGTNVYLWTGSRWVTP